VRRGGGTAGLGIGCGGRTREQRAHVGSSCRLATFGGEQSLPARSSVPGATRSAAGSPSLAAPRRSSQPHSVPRKANTSGERGWGETVHPPHLEDGGGRRSVPRSRTSRPGTAKGTERASRPFSCLARSAVSWNRVGTAAASTDSAGSSTPSASSMQSKPIQ
jgi:hypothetical protein